MKKRREKNMYIAIKKRNNRANESLVVFEFMSQEEANDFFCWYE